MKFKAFETLDNLYKLYEAAEDEAEASEDTTDDEGSDSTGEDESNGEEGTEATDGIDELEDDQNPEVQADPTDGKFVSDLEKAEFAKTALNALLFSPIANKDIIPAELKNITANDITANNADAIINGISKLVKKLNENNDVSFNALKTLDKLYSIYEAAENNDEPIDATEAVNAVDDTESADDETEQDNKFISDEKKLELAKTAFNALFTDPPDEGTIPKELLNVTTNNADNVINFVTACINLETPLTLTNQNQPDSLPNVLQHV